MLLNDMHISKDCILEFTANWNEAIAVCSRLHIAVLVIGGDLFLSRSAQTLDVLLTVHDAFLAAAQAGIDIFLANGNHDKTDQEALRGYCHVFDQHGNVETIDECHTLSRPQWGFLLHTVPYFPEEGSFTEKLGRLLPLVDKSRLNYLYIHEGINGALSRPAGKELPASFLIFDGNYKS